MAEHTEAKLAEALAAIPGVPVDMVRRALGGYYHDFKSPLATPVLQLYSDLHELAKTPATPRDSRPRLRELAERVKAGEFDASQEESDAWARSAEGQETMAKLTGKTPGRG